jgi:NAD(P)-dependent dehydrogenase (short-subunit alcohol dehydrogenase family)
MSTPKVVLVTGASSGFGALTVRAVADGMLGGCTAAEQRTVATGMELWRNGKRRGLSAREISWETA